MSWPQVPIKRIAKIIGGSTPSADPANWDGDVNWLSPTDVSPHHGDFVGESARKLTRRGLASCGAAVAPAGSVVVTTRAPIGNVTITAVPSATNQGCRTILPDGRLDARFLRYQLQVRVPELQSRGSGSTFLELSGNALGMVPIYAPPYPDQARTADFLDRECARIAQLEAELVSMDAVLDEALATSVEHVIFDDGGDGWYGTTKYPLRSLGALGILADGDWVEAPYITDEGIRLVQTGNIGRGHFRGDSKKFISPETFRQLNCTEVLPRDVLFSRLNLPIARGCLAPSDAGTMVASVDVAILRVGPDVLPEYVVALASTDRWLRWLGQMARGTTMLRIARSQLGRVRIPLPPLETQRAIANAFEAAKAATGRARAEISQLLAALSEYRDALITEAVTGRVDMSRLGEAQLAEAVHAASEGAGWEVVAS